MKTPTLCLALAAFAAGGAAVSLAQEERPPEAPRRTAPPEILERFDKDGDGRLNEEERAALRAEFGNRPPGARGGPGGAPRGEREKTIVPRFDVDGDGILNDDERKKARVHAKANPAGRGGGAGGRRGGRRPGGRRPGGTGGPGDGGGQPPKPGESVVPGDVPHNPEAGLYDPGVIHTLFLEFDAEDWESELADFYRTDVDVPAKLTVDGITLEQPVGVAFRGNSSYFTVGAGSKRSFNLSIDAFDGGQRLKGYNTLNLLNAHADPSFIREALFSHVASHYVPIYKVNFVKVVINGESWGVYVNAQQFNKDFLEEHYETRKGVRWKVPAGGNAGFRYQGDDREAYKSGYQMKTNAGEEAWDRLITLCKTLKDATPETAIETLEPILDIDEALWFLALDNVFQDGDGYQSRASDYVFYEDPDQRFHILHYDSNETFRPSGSGGPGLGGPGGGRRGGRRPGGARPGGDRPGGERPGGDRPGGERPGGERPGGERPGGERPGGEPNRGGPAFDRVPLTGADEERLPLAKALLSVPSLRARYLDHVRVLTEDWLSWDKIEPIATRYRELIREEVAKDTRKLYPTEAFEKSLSEEVAAGRRPLPSLKMFVEERAKFLKGHPDLSGQAPRVVSMTSDPVAQPGEPLVIGAMVTKDTEAVVMIHHRSGGKGPFTVTPMAAREEGFEATLPGHPAGTKVEYYLEARTVDGGVTSFFPRRGERAPAVYRVAIMRTGEPSPVRLNELMASNLDSVADPQGEFDDWIELHNTGEDVVDLSGYALSDDEGNLRKWEFPKGTTIAPGGYLLVWADEDGKKKKGLHANFKLAKGGETVVLSNPHGDVIDFMAFGSLEEGEAYARSGDAWAVQPASPAKANAGKE
jgi:hypothetical protein